MQPKHTRSRKCLYYFFIGLNIASKRFSTKIDQNGCRSASCVNKTCVSFVFKADVSNIHPDFIRGYGALSWNIIGGYEKDCTIAELYNSIKSGYEVSTSGPSRMNYQTTM